MGSYMMENGWARREKNLKISYIQKKGTIV